MYSDFTLWYLLMYSQLLELNLIESLQAWEAHNPSICPLAASFFLCMYKTFVNCPWSLHFPAQRCISIFTQEKKNLKCAVTSRQNGLLVLFTCVFLFIPCFSSCICSFLFAWHVYKTCESGRRQVSCYKHSKKDGISQENLAFMLFHFLRKWTFCMLQTSVFKGQTFLFF